MFSLTVEAVNKYTLQPVDIQGMSIEILYGMDGESDFPHTATAVSENYYEFDEGHVYNIRANLYVNGVFKTYDVMSNLGQNPDRKVYSMTIYCSIGVIPSPRASLKVYKLSPTGRGSINNLADKLYAWQNDDWVLIEDNPSLNDKAYFWTTLDSSKRYKFVIIKEGFLDTVIYRDGTYPTGDIYVRKENESHIFIVTKDTRGESISGATITVEWYRNHEIYNPQVVSYNNFLQGYYFEYVDTDTYHDIGITAEKSGYNSATDRFTYTATGQDYTRELALEKIPEYATLTVTATDAKRGTTISDAEIIVTNNTTGDIVEPVAGEYQLLSNYGDTYTLTVAATDYVSVSDVIDPNGETEIERAYELQKTYRYKTLTVAVEDAHGVAIDDATVIVHNVTDDEPVTPSDINTYELIRNDGIEYRLTVEKTGYYSYTTTIIPEDTPDAIDETVTLTKIPVPVPLYVSVIDDYTHAPVSDVTITVLNTETGEYVTPTDDHWIIYAETGYGYQIEAEAPGYYDYESEIFYAEDCEGIYKTCEMEAEPLYKPLTVSVTDAETGKAIPATVTVRNLTKGVNVDPDTDGKYYLYVDVLAPETYKVYVTAKGYPDCETDAFTVTDTVPMYKPIILEAVLTPFATFEDLRNRTGINYTLAEKERIKYLLIDVSDLIRYEGRKCGVDVDAEVARDRVYKSIVKTVTCDVTQRVLRQSQTGDALSQESQSALGYSWSGTYAIPGGGTAMSLMRNEKDILGFNPQTIGVIELC